MFVFDRLLVASKVVLLRSQLSCSILRCLLQSGSRLQRLFVSAGLRGENAVRGNGSEVGGGAWDGTCLKASAMSDT